VGPLDPAPCSSQGQALGLARIGADDVDVQSVQRPPKLGHTVAAQCSRVIDAKYPMLVTVKRHWLASGFKVGACRMEVGKCRLALDKLEVHQPAGRVIDEDKQCALRAAILEPPMLAAVDLHQFADAFAAIARLVDGLSPLLAIESQPGFDHP